MRIRKLDPDGRVCRPVPPKQAIREVQRGYADWLHADGIPPNTKHGTIILTRPVKELPTERTMTQIFNGDGEFLGWLWADTAELWVRKGKIAQVGSSLDGRPRAVILPRVVDSKAMADVRRIEAWRIAEGVRARADLRQKIEAHLHDLRGERMEDAIVESCELYLGAPNAKIAVTELQDIRRRVTALELALAPDLAKIRKGLAD